MKHTTTKAVLKELRREFEVQRAYHNERFYRSNGEAATSHFAKEGAYEYAINAIDKRLNENAIIARK